MIFEDFQTYFWSYIPEQIVTNLDRSIENTDFCDAVCYDSFRLYTQSNISIDLVCKMAENMLVSVNRFKPILGK